MTLSNLTQVEINSIRESVCAHITVSSKLSSYANKISDSDIKQMFKTASTKADDTANKLIQML